MKARAQLRVIEGGRQPADTAVPCEPQSLKMTIRRRKPQGRRLFAAPLAITMLATCFAAPWAAFTKAF